MQQSKAAPFRNAGVSRIVEAVSGDTTPMDNEPAANLPSTAPAAAPREKARPVRIKHRAAPALDRMRVVMLPVSILLVAVALALPPVV